jgi:hypothetical protein
MDIVFWSSAMAEVTAQRHIDWVNMDLTSQREIVGEEILGGLECYLKTRSTMGISVNGVGLRRSEDSSWRAVRLRTGDEIEIFDGAKGFLRYRCEFYIGLAKDRRQRDVAVSVGTCPGLQAWSEGLMQSNSARPPPAG